MKNLSTFFFLLVSILPLHYLQAQCDIEAFAYIDTLVCGDCVELVAFGEGQGTSVFTETFDSGAPTGWAFTQQATFTNPCSPGGVNGTTHIWMGDQSGVPRTLETFSFDFSTAVAGVTICFDMLFAEQGGTSPCEGPDEADEGVYLEYSIDGGTTWVEINYFDPNGGADPLLINWNNWCFPLPAAALTSDTKIRWFQDNDSGAEFDHWGIDNVNIYFNDPTYEIIWQHDNFSYGIGSAGGANPTPVCPTTETTYTVVMSNGTHTCSASVTIPVRNPDLVVDVQQDASICAGDCVDLNAEATVIVSPASTPTFENTEFQAIQTGLGAVTEIVINVQGLNMNTVEPNSITEVCLTQLSYFGIQIIPFEQTDIGDLNVFLQCPDGNQITLVPAGITTGGANPLTGGYTNTCFVPGGPAINTSTSPYTGGWSPNEPFNDLVGCTSNGEWLLVVESATALGFGTGTFFGWNITFDDPEISYEADYSWSPTTAMTGSNTLNPQVCPTSTETYTLTAMDNAGCVTETSSVTITVDPACSCPLYFDPSDSPENCGNSDGSITMDMIGGSGNFTYNWDNGNMTNSDTGLPAGSYTITVTDQILACSRDTTIVLLGTDSPTLVIDNIIDESCTGNDGSANANVSNGTLPYTYNWSNGQNGQVATNLSVGNYTLTVTDQNSCSVTSAVTIANTCGCNLTASTTSTDLNCFGSNDGMATVNFSGGTPPITYLWNDALNQTTATATNLNAGIYIVTVTDNNFCSATASVEIVEPSPLVVVIGGNSFVTCAGADNGYAEIFPADILGGTAPYSILWDNGATTNATNTLDGGVHFATITDNNGCETLASTVIDEPSPISINTTFVEPAGCTVCSGSAVVAVLGGWFNDYDYNWSNGATDNNPTGLCQGQYTLTVTNTISGTLPGNCPTITTVTIGAVDSIQIAGMVSDVGCFGDSNGSIDLSLTFASMDVDVLWSNGATTEDIFNLDSGSYTVTVIDNETGCGAIETFLVNSPSQIMVDAGEDQGIEPGQSATLMVDPVIPNLLYTWEGTDGSVFTGETIEVSPLSTTEYTVIASFGNCIEQDQVTVFVTDFVFPNAFSPNSDGENDEFYIVQEGELTVIEFKVFDRWGQKVHDDPLNPWDGKFRGKDLPMDTYVYMASVQILNGERKEVHGDVLLLR